MATTQSDNFSSLVLVRSTLTINKAKYPTEAIAVARATKWLGEQVQLPKEVVERMQPRMERSLHHYYADVRAEYDLGLEVDGAEMQSSYSSLPSTTPRRSCVPMLGGAAESRCGTDVFLDAESGPTSWGAPVAPYGTSRSAIVSTPRSPAPREMPVVWESRDAVPLSRGGEAGSRKSCPKSGDLSQRISSMKSQVRALESLGLSGERQQALAKGRVSPTASVVSSSSRCTSSSGSAAPSSAESDSANDASVSTFILAPPCTPADPPFRMSGAMRGCGASVRASVISSYPTSQPRSSDVVVPQTQQGPIPASPVSRPVPTPLDVVCLKMSPAKRRFLAPQPRPSGTPAPVDEAQEYIGSEVATLPEEGCRAEASGEEEEEEVTEEAAMSDTTQAECPAAGRVDGELASRGGTPCGAQAEAVAQPMTPERAEMHNFAGEGTIEGAVPPSQWSEEPQAQPWMGESGVAGPPGGAAPPAFGVRTWAVAVVLIVALLLQTCPTRANFGAYLTALNREEHGWLYGSVLTPWQKGTGRVVFSNYYLFATGTVRKEGSEPQAFVGFLSVWLPQPHWLAGMCVLFAAFCASAELFPVLQGSGARGDRMQQVIDGVFLVWVYDSLIPCISASNMANPFVCLLVLIGVWLAAHLGIHALGGNRQICGASTALVSFFLVFTAASHLLSRFGGSVGTRPSGYELSLAVSKLSRESVASLLFAVSRGEQLAALHTVLVFLRSPGVCQSGVVEVQAAIGSTLGCLVCLLL